MMKRESIQPASMHKRVVGGQVLYSHVVAVEGRRMIFVAGQLARDHDGNIVGKGDMRAQIRQVGENLRTALAAAGATLNDLVKTTTFVTDIDEFFRHADVRMEYFGPGAADQHDGRSAATGSPRLSRRGRGDRHDGLRRHQAVAPSAAAGAVVSYAGRYLHRSASLDLTDEARALRSGAGGEFGKSTMAWRCPANLVGEGMISSLARRARVAISDGNTWLKARHNRRWAGPLKAETRVRIPCGS
jgi:2-iminobutanoate/2-iminopropanoate deaminase